MNEWTVYIVNIASINPVVLTTQSNDFKPLKDLSEELSKHHQFQLQPRSTTISTKSQSQASTSSTTILTIQNRNNKNLLPVTATMTIAYHSSNITITTNHNNVTTIPKDEEAKRNQGGKILA